VSTLVHLFSIGTCTASLGTAAILPTSRFSFSMLGAVLAESFLFIYISGAGGALSYLLIGFWFVEEVGVRRGKKAFIVKRWGFGFLIGI